MAAGKASVCRGGAGGGGGREESWRVIDPGAGDNSEGYWQVLPRLTGQDGRRKESPDAREHDAGEGMGAESLSHQAARHSPPTTAGLSEAGDGGDRQWDSVEGEEGEVSFLGEEWKDVAVPSELAASCSGSKRYLHENADTCAGVLVLSHLACNGQVGVHFVEAWSREHIDSVLRAVRRRMHVASTNKSTLFVIDASGLHFILGGSGLRAGFDGACVREGARARARARASERAIGRAQERGRERDCKIIRETTPWETSDSGGVHHEERRVPARDVGHHRPISQAGAERTLTRLSFRRRRTDKRGWGAGGARRGTGGAGQATDRTVFLLWRPECAQQLEHRCHELGRCRGPCVP